MFLARGKVKEAEGEELPAGLLGGPASGKRGLSTEEAGRVAFCRSALPCQHLREEDEGGEEAGMEMGI